MNEIRSLLLFFLIALMIPRTTFAQRYVLADVNIVDVVKGTVQPRQHLVIEGKRIVDIVDNQQLITGRIERTFNLNGAYVMPGLWDMSVENSLGTEWFNIMMAHGITGVRLMGVNPDSLAHWKERKEAGEALPIVRGTAAPVAPTHPDSAWRDLESLQRAGVDFIDISPNQSRTDFLAVLDAAERRRIPAVATLPPDISIYEALRKGIVCSEGGNGILIASSIQEEYLRDAAWGVRTDPGLETEAGVRSFLMETYSRQKADSVTAILGRRGLWLCPTLTAQEALGNMEDSVFRQDERMAYISPQLRDDWEAKAKNPQLSWSHFAVERALFEILRNLTGRYEVTKVPVLAGSGTGQPYVFPGSGLHDELAHLVDGGMTIQTALQTATLNPVRFFGLESDYGSVEVGKIADLVILDRNPLLDIRHTREVKGVVLDGKYYQKLALQMKMATIEDRHKRQEIIPMMITAFETGGVEALRQQYKDLEAEDIFKRKYNFDESSLEEVGRRLMDMGEYESAIEVFQLNAGAYPRSWRVYRSLGEAYELAEKPEQALSSFQKAAELAPGNYDLQAAIDRLK